LTAGCCLLLDALRGRHLEDEEERCPKGYWIIYMNMYQDLRMLEVLF
jgi:hypothetical protein